MSPSTNRLSWKKLLLFFILGALLAALLFYLFR